MLGDGCQVTILRDTVFVPKGLVAGVFVIRMRSVLHVNLEHFFVEVERRRRPELVGKPVIVGKPKGSTSGVVVSASPEARKAGVEEGTSVRQAQHSCPGAIVPRANYAECAQVASQFLDSLVQYSPLVEPDSPGSAYVDVTASRNLFDDAGARIISDIFDRLRLPVCVGCASNKLLAGIASGMGRKITRVAPGSEAGFLAGLPINALDAVTGKIEKRLRELGVTTVGMLAGIDERLLTRQFGPVGGVIKKQSLGIDWSPVKAAYPREIIIIEHTFDNEVEEPAEIEAHLRDMACDAQAKLRKKGCLTGEVTLSLLDESAPSQPSTFNFQLSTHNDSAYSIFRALVKMLGHTMRPGMRISGVQVLLSGLTRGEGLQLCLIGEGERRRRLDGAVELIRERFGEGSVCLATSLIPTGRARVLSRIAA